MVGYIESAAGLAKPKSKSLNKTAAGTSGTKINSGLYDEEYLGKIMGDRGVEIYDKMRRSDGQAKMLLSVVKNPIKSAKWQVQPATQDDKDIKIAEFIEHVLFNNIGYINGKAKTFREFISEVLTMIEFGFSLFEVVHKLVKGDKVYGDYIGIADFGFRHQRSITKWILDRDGSILSVKQDVYGDLRSSTFISGQHSLVFSMDKEGDNYEGISMLRSCYGAYYRKNIYKQVQGIGIERAAKGVVVGKLSPDIAVNDIDDQTAAFQELIDALGNYALNGVVIGADTELQELKISHDAEKVLKAIDAENTEMTKSFLANFMELGMSSGSGGSYSLGSDLSDIFLSGIQYIADGIAESINIHVIKKLVNAKFGDVDAYPKLKVTGINDKAGKEFAEILAMLADRDIVQVSTGLQEYAHKRLDLPALDDDIRAKDEEMFKTEPPKPVENKAELSDIKKNCGDDDLMCVFQLSEKDRDKFPISAMIEDYASEILSVMDKSLRLRSEKYIDGIMVRVRKGGIKTRNDVFKMKLPNNRAYKTALILWAEKVINEVYPATVAEVKSGVSLADIGGISGNEAELIIAQSNLIAKYQDQDIEKIIAFTFNGNYGVVSKDNLDDEMRRALAQYFAKNAIETSSVNMASSVVNSARKEAFLSPELEQEVESFVYTNGDPRSAICKNLAGKVLTSKQLEETQYYPPNHHNCKSYLVAQTRGDKDNKPVTGLEITGTQEEKTKALRSKTL